MQVHLLRCVIGTCDGATHVVALKFYEDQKAAEKECAGRNASLKTVVEWRVTAPSGQVGGPLGMIMQSLGVMQVGFDVVSVETEGAIVKPDTKIVLAH